MDAISPSVAFSLLAGAMVLACAATTWRSVRSVRAANAALMRTTNELQVSDERYHRFFDESPVALYRTSPEGAILDANQALAELLGYENPSELVGVSARAHHANPADRDEFRMVLDQSRVVSARTTELRRRDGRNIWVVDTTVAVRGPGGKVMHYEGCLVDITERRAAASKLEASERWFRALIEQSTDGIALLSRDGTILYQSPAAERLLGRPHGDRVGTRFDENVHPDDRQSATATFSAVAASPGAVVQTVVRVKHGADGEWHTYETLATNRLDDPDVNAIVVNFRDVTAAERR